ncbi:MAG TPA: heme exporter protein CcmD [Burkholderiales bacterium]|nr:heme exporter protein CcmD [Burkholderiales bacterium]
MPSVPACIECAISSWSASRTPTGSASAVRRVHELPRAAGARRSRGPSAGARSLLAAAVECAGAARTPLPASGKPGAGQLFEGPSPGRIGRLGPVFGGASKSDCGQLPTLHRLHSPYDGRGGRMTWSSPEAFFSMGGYAIYVWGSYAVAAACIAAELWLLRRRHRTLAHGPSRTTGARGPRDASWPR